MDKEQEKKNTVNGFLFGNDEDVELADQELNAVKMIDQKLQGKSKDTIMNLYQAALDKKVFRTPVGYSYLHELQKKLISMGVSRDDISGIPMYQVFNNNKKDEKVPRVITVNKTNEKLKRNNTILTLINVILIILILVMFAISFSGSSPNVLNYRRTIENEYAQWQQDLTERENAIKIKERELNINN